MTKDSILQRKYKTLMPSGLPYVQDVYTLPCYRFGLPISKEVKVGNNGSRFTISDINRVSNIGVNNNLMLNTGFAYSEFDKEYCEAIGGYPKNAILVFNEYYVMSMHDDNMHDFTELGIDNINWKYIDNTIDIESGIEIKELFHETIPVANITGNNNGKWVKIKQFQVNSFGSLLRTFHEQTPSSTTYSLDTIIEVSFEENGANIDPDVLIGSQSNSSTFFTQQIYTSSVLTHSENVNWAISSGTSYAVNIRNSTFDIHPWSSIYALPNMYCSLWVKNKDYVSTDLEWHLYLQNV